MGLRNSTILLSFASLATPQTREDRVCTVSPLSSGSSPASLCAHDWIRLNTPVNKWVARLAASTCTEVALASRFRPGPHTPLFAGRAGWTMESGVVGLPSRLGVLQGARQSQPSGGGEEVEQPAPKGGRMAAPRGLLGPPIQEMQQQAAAMAAEVKRERKDGAPSAGELLRPALEQPAWPQEQQEQQSAQDQTAEQPAEQLAEPRGQQEGRPSQPRSSRRQQGRQRRRQQQERSSAEEEEEEEQQQPQGQGTRYIGVRRSIREGKPIYTMMLPDVPNPQGLLERWRFEFPLPVSRWRLWEEGVEGVHISSTPEFGSVIAFCAGQAGRPPLPELVLQHCTALMQASAVAAASNLQGKLPLQNTPDCTHAVVQERAARYYDKAVIWKALRSGAPLAGLRLNRPLRWVHSKGSGIDAAMRHELAPWCFVHGAIRVVAAGLRWRPSTFQVGTATRQAQARHCCSSALLSPCCCPLPLLSLFAASMRPSPTCWRTWRAWTTRVPGTGCCRRTMRRAASSRCLASCGSRAERGSGKLWGGEAGDWPECAVVYSPVADCLHRAVAGTCRFCGARAVCNAWCAVLVKRARMNVHPLQAGRGARGCRQQLPAAAAGHSGSSRHGGMRPRRPRRVLCPHRPAAGRPAVLAARAAARWRRQQQPAGTQPGGWH